MDEKLEAYLTIDSIQAYILFEQHKPMAIIMRRTENGYLRETTEGLSTEIELPFLAIRLPLSEIYARVDFTASIVNEPEWSYEIE